MDSKNVILVFIAILIIALMAVAVYTFTNHGNDVKNATDNMTKNDTKVNNTNVTNTTTNTTNKTIGDNSTLNKTLNNTNKTYKVYNPQSDSYVDVIGEKFDAEVNRWYTFDTDGVRYYNTRIN